MVSGGAGFIGSHLVDALVARGDEVTVSTTSRPAAARTSPRRSGAGREARSRPTSPTEATGGGSATRLRPERVFHLAAQVDVRISVGDPGLTRAVNVEGTVNLLEAARECRRRRLRPRLQLRRLRGAGEPATVPLTETAPLRPGSPYGQAKLAAEGYVGALPRPAPAAAASLRFGNVYGPRQGAVGEAGVVSIFCKRARRGRPADRLRQRHPDP